MTARGSGGVPTRVRGGLGVRLMGAFALLAVTPTLLLGWLAMSRARSDVELEVVRGNLALIRSLGQQLNDTLQDTRRALEVSAGFLAQKSPGERTVRTLRVLRSEFSILRQVTFLNRKGKWVMGDRLAKGVGFSLDLANTYGGYVSEVLHHEGESRKVFMVVQSRDRKGELMGFLAAVVDLSFVQSRLSEARLGPGATLLVVDGNARPVASSGALPARSKGSTLRRDNPAVDQVLSTHSEGHLQMTDAAGQDWVAVYRNIAGMSQFRGVRWGVLLLQPTADAFALARKATRDTVLVAAVVLLIALGLGAILARRITRPLASLVRHTELVAEENFEVDFEPSERSDEIGVLGRSFANMVQRLARSRDNLYALTELRENLVRSIPAGVISVDRDGVVQSINPAQEKLSEIPAAEVVGLSIHQVFMARAGDEPVLEQLRELLLGGAPVDLTLDNKRTPFTEEPRLRYRIRVAPLRDRQGRVDGAVILQEDLSEGARLEAQLLRTEKLSSVGVLAAGVAHEINNPLTTILGYAKLLLESRAANEEDPDRAALELMADEARRVQEIVRNLLDFSRQEPGQVLPVPLEELLERTLNLAAPDLRKRGIQVERRYGEGVADALADGRRMEQVLVNLITNAAHAMESGGRLAVATGADPARPGQVYAEVSDSGAGISADDLGRIFDPFFSTKEPGEGTGLGLAVSHGIVGEHGGEIEVQSEQGEGATFRVWLPAAGL